jgi:phosphotransacetylase
MLDNINILNNDEQDFIFKVLEKRRINKEEANLLTNIFRKYVYIFESDIKVRLEDINNNIEEIDDIDVKNLSKEII